MSYNLMLGNNLDSLKKLPDNSVDSVVTDPPYGLSFMNKKWDYDVPSVEFWKEVHRVLKPGGHILSFGGTRTYHRMVVNIEDAGFEIRDQIMWLYGSGFPKSHNIGKAVDKLQGNERVEWEGWGTAMKPAQEIIAVAQKPENLEGTALNLIYIIKSELWKLYVKIVESSSELNQVEQKEVLDTALCLVERNTNIQVALQGLMDMSQLRLMENICWNTVGLWSNILEDLYQKMSRYTTSTKSNLIIDLKTLKSLEWQNILENIIQVKNNQIDGVNVNVLTAEVLFNALNLKLKDIQRHSVEDNVIYKDDKMDCLNEPICLARKPLSEKSVAENVLKWRTGGINVDGCRVGTEVLQTQLVINGAPFNALYTERPNSLYDENGKRMLSEPQEGRFPANIILECICDEVIKGEKGEPFNYKGKEYSNKETSMFNGDKPEAPSNYNDKGDIHTNPNCPCRLMDEQSGVSKTNCKSGVVEGKDANVFNDGEKKTSGHKKKVMVGDYSDKGGASRYFQQVKGGGTEDFFIYKENNIIVWNIKSLDTQELEMVEYGEASDVLKQARESICLKPELYGNNTLVKYLMTTISITKMKTHSIMTFTILNAYTKMSIGHFTLMIDENQSQLLTEESILNVQIVSNQNALVSSIKTNQEVLVPIVNYVLEENLVSGETTIENTIMNTTENIGASRFVYQAKVSKKERNMGLDGFEEKESQQKGHGLDRVCMNEGCGVSMLKPELCKCDTPDWRPRPKKNTHPTLKPINLMAYLCRLITPPNGIILDPFMGSGSTGIAALLEGFDFIGMEVDEDYMKISEARISNFEKYREFLKK